MCLRLLKNFKYPNEGTGLKILKCNQDEYIPAFMNYPSMQIGKWYEEKNPRKLIVGHYTTDGLPFWVNAIIGFNSVFGSDKEYLSGFHIGMENKKILKNLKDFDYDCNFEPYFLGKVSYKDIVASGYDFMGKAIVVKSIKLEKVISVRDITSKKDPYEYLYIENFI